MHFFLHHSSACSLLNNSFTVVFYSCSKHMPHGLFCNLQNKPYVAPSFDFPSISQHRLRSGSFHCNRQTWNLIQVWPGSENALWKVHLCSWEALNILSSSTRKEILEKNLISGPKAQLKFHSSPLEGSNTPVQKRMRGKGYLIRLAQKVAHPEQPSQPLPFLLPAGAFLTQQNGAIMLTKGFI